MRSCPSRSYARRPVHPQTRVLGLQRERETVWALGDGRETASAPVDSQTMPGMEVMICDGPGLALQAVLSDEVGTVR